MMEFLGPLLIIALLIYWIGRLGTACDRIKEMHESMFADEDDEERP